MSNLSLKDLNSRPVKLTSGHRLCAGCAESIIARQVLMSTDKPIVASSATGCFDLPLLRMERPVGAHRIR